MFCSRTKKLAAASGFGNPRKKGPDPVSGSGPSGSPDPDRIIINQDLDVRKKTFSYGIVIHQYLDVRKKIFLCEKEVMKHSQKVCT